jgi:hypothetical protein
MRAPLAIHLRENLSPMHSFDFKGNLIWMLNKGEIAPWMNNFWKLNYFI